ncbi:hypothetical protein L227DRAFT_554699 [Lentinus tigrinus ALCF2SS1-6]|uniref:Protein kinase domain-containing protein n=2 Tax=Lentinus tigrinus TaxID=5365 RepID=A0A5C2RVC9_9APHY|nr:hypothetical protein L227DRAFT_554699 [Lentinus tigrinus ALCF2SS1-6]
MLDVPEDELDTVVKRAHIESLRTAVATLHAHGWVFGDVREGNIFLPEDSVQLIDFDWCGKEGEARYPDDINLKSIEWHEGVSRGGLIKKEHDEYVLKKICDRYTFD